MSTNSTGPRTPEGKERSSANALKHGLCSERPVLPGENPDEWDKFRISVVERFAPEDVVEAEQVERVALHMWRLRRVARYEREVATDGYNAATENVAKVLVGDNPSDPQ